MNLIFHNPGIDSMVRSILMFQTDDETAFWSDSLYYFYSQLDREKAKGLAFADRKRYIEKTIRDLYQGLEAELNQKAEAYQAAWGIHRKQIEDALSEAFALDCAALFNQMRCDVSLNPVSPRFLQEQRFEVFYLNSPQGAIGTSIHEIIHFVWFYVWNRLFHDSYDQYERPSLKWILSEMVVESIMRDPRLCGINPYFPREQGGCIYPYFFTMTADGESVLAVIDEMYRTLGIQAFMKECYAYCLAHEKQIRRHISASEQSSRG